MFDIKLQPYFEIDNSLIKDINLIAKDEFPKSINRLIDDCGNELKIALGI